MVPLIFGENHVVLRVAPLATFIRVRKLSVNCKKLAGHYKGGDFVIEAVTKGNIGAGNKADLAADMLI